MYIKKMGFEGGGGKCDFQLKKERKKYIKYNMGFENSSFIIATNSKIITGGQKSSLAKTTS